VLYAWFGRSLAPLQRLFPVLAAVTVTVVAGAGLALASGGFEWDALLGAYGTVGEQAPSILEVLREIVWHTGGLFLLVLGLPLLATLALAVGAARGREADPDVRAFLAATLAYCAWLVIEVALFASRYVTHVAERYLITAAAPLLLGFCLWLARGAPRPRIVLGLGVLLVAAVAAIPVDHVAVPTAAHDLLTTTPLLDVADRWPGAARGALIGAAVLLAAAFALLPRRWLGAAAGALALGFVLLSVEATRTIAGYSDREQQLAFGGAPARWVDDVVGGGDTVLLNSGQREWTADARTLFWNRRVGEVLRLPDAAAYGPVPQREVTPRFTGELVGPDGRLLEPAYVTAPTGVLFVGEKLAETPVTETQPGAALWRVEAPLRLRQRVEGLTPSGDVAGVARVSVFACRPGRLELTVLGKDGGPLAVRVDGIPLRTIELAPDSLWEGAIPAPRYADGDSRCIYELESAGLVGFTRIEFVPA
jgi:hypothetical protein